MSTKIKNPQLDTVLDEWCKTISEDIAERRFYDKQEVAAYAKIKLHTAITECLAMQEDSLSTERLQLAAKYGNPNISRRAKDEIAVQLTVINAKIKERNKALMALEDKRDYEGIRKEKKSKIPMSNQGAFLIGRLTSINPTKVYKETTLIRTFKVALSFNVNNPGVNESNYVQFTLKQEKVSLIDDFKIGEIIVCHHTVHGLEVKNNPDIHINNLVCTKILSQADVVSAHDLS